MASELRVTTLKDASGNNSVATSVVFNGSAKVWLYAPATVASISDSFNISSLDDDGTGEAGMNLTSNMGSANYVTQVTHQTTNVNAGGGNNVRGCAFNSKSSSVMEARTFYVLNDCYALYEGIVYYNASAHGDLA